MSEEAWRKENEQAGGVKEEKYERWIAQTRTMKAMSDVRSSEVKD